MPTPAEEIMAKIQGLSDKEKLRIVDFILNQLQRTDPEIDRAWAAEATGRWEAYKAGELGSVSYEEVMARFRDRRVARISR